MSENASSPLPIGVVIPCWNNAEVIPRHLKSVERWLDLVKEVVVVDSFSNDATVELLREGLKHPNVRILSHPRGLYQSWNFGIQQVSSKYTYISTVGDMMTREGLEQLHAIAEQYQSEVTLSPPRFTAEQGEPVLNCVWPIFRLIEWKNIRKPQALSSLEAFLISALMTPSGVLGSSASNLYRTDLLQRCPFPTDYGHYGDSAWCLLHGLEARFAVTPAVVSEFLVHAGAPGRDSSRSLARRFFDVACAICREKKLGELAAEMDLLRDETVAMWSEEECLEKARAVPAFWALNPAAWRARSRRNGHRERLEQLENRLRVKYFGPTP